jgi:geranylgeranyl diphosphate synthase type II
MMRRTSVSLGEDTGLLRARIEETLEEVLASDDPRESRLVEAMRYSVLGGGKRIRPILCLAAYRAVGGIGEDAIPAAAALELIHAYSLVHDDLPCMDDDSLRRGKPTTHKAYGEGMAVLVGDALLTLAFELLGTVPDDSPVPAERRLDVLRKIAKAAGVRGMIGGQVGDLEALDDPLNADLIEYVHAHKTGALIAVSVWAGARLGTDDPDALARLGRFGERIGFAFQIVDDILDHAERPEEPANYAACHGVAAARERAQSLIKDAKEDLEPFGGQASLLRDLADFVLARTH